MGQLELLQHVTATLDEIGVPYMLTGSYASSLQGQPRATHDVDLVVSLHPSQIEQLLSAFPADHYYFSADAVNEAVRDRRMFNILDTQEGDKIDFRMLTDDPFDQERFERRITIPIGERSIQVSTPEDTILMKLKWAADSGGSERQTVDARRVYEVSRDGIDEEYLARWALALGVSEALAQIRPD